MDLERSASINSSLGSRVAQCSLNGLADFLFRYQQVLKLLVKVDGGGSGSDSSVCRSLVSVSSVKSRCFMRGCRAACSETTRTDTCRKPSHWSTAALRSGTDTQILQDFYSSTGDFQIRNYLVLLLCVCAEASCSAVLSATRRSARTLCVEPTKLWITSCSRESECCLNACTCTSG